jgi:LysR family glycine cleavage system transcriptional activator
MPGRKLPPLNALRAFEAAARHQNLSRAAQELRVTHGAVSRQVAKLEEYLDARLFEHKHQQVVLTKKGAAYAARLQTLFDELQAATLANFDAHPDRGVLRIGVLPTFAMRLLVPRLARFKQRFPDIELKVETYTSPRPNDPDLLLDIGIWNGPGGWPDLICEPLFHEELVPVGSPALIAGHTIRVPDDLEPFLLLHALRRPGDWKAWIELVGARRLDPERGLDLEYSGLVYQGAIDGLGIAMAQTMFIQDDVEQGRLVPLFSTPLTTGQAYYLVYTAAVADQPKVRHFVDWLKEEVAQLRQRPALAAAQ